MKSMFMALILLAIVANSSLFAQDINFIERGKVNLGGTISYNRVSEGLNGSPYSTLYGNTQIGYFLTKHLTADIAMAYITDFDGDSETSIGVGGRIFISNFYTGYTYFWNMQNNYYPSLWLPQHGYDFQTLKAGYIFKLAENVGLDLGANYAFGQNHNYWYYSDDRQISNFSLNLGLQVMLGRSSQSNTSPGSSSSSSTAKVKQTPVLLEDARLNDLAYYLKLQTNALASLGGATKYLGKNSFPSDFTYMYEAFTSASDDIAWSNETGLQALGLRQDVVKMRAEAAGSSSGNAGAGTVEASANLQQMIDSKIQSGIQLSESQKQYFLVSLTYLGAAIAKEVILAKNATDYVNYVKGLKGTQKLKEAPNLPKAVEMVSKLPNSIASQLKTLKTYIDIAKTNNITIPDDVTKLLDN